MRSAGGAMRCVELPLQVQMHLLVQHVRARHAMPDRAAAEG